MANNLTGDYEAVLQIRLLKINAILATLHQAQLDTDPPISFPHSASIRVGDSAFTSTLMRARQRLMKWTGKAIKELGEMTGSTDDARAMLSSKAPPGIAAMFANAWRDLDLSTAAPALTGSDLDLSMVEPIDSSAFRPRSDMGGELDLTLVEPVPAAGRVDCQISTPTIEILAGSQVKAHVWVRAHFYRDDGTLVPTVPIHGEIRAVYVAMLVKGGSALRVQLTSDDNQIEFFSTTLLSPANAQTIITHVRAALRKQVVALDVNLPAGFAFSEFKSLGAGDTEAAVLPLDLSGTGLPAGGLGSLTNHFLGTDDFAVAVSKEYVQLFFKDLKTSIQTALARITITFKSVFTGTTNYTLSLTSLGVNWNPGSVEIVGSVDVTGTGGLAPSGFVSFKQGLEVVLVGQAVSVRPTGDPVVDESWFIPHDRAVSEVKSARDGALPGASAALSKILDAARSNLVSALTKFDPSASASFTALDWTVDGIIVRGKKILMTDRRAPVVSYGDVPGKSMTAGPSWIPGGRIESFVWSWVTTDNPIPWKNTTETNADGDRFIWKKTAGAIAYGSVCLRILGTRLTPHGWEPVDVGTVCSNQAMGPPWLRHPPEWMRQHLPLWWPDWPRRDVAVSERVAGHVSVVGDDPAAGRITTNVLVYFTGLLRNRPLQELARAVGLMRRRDASLLIVLVLPNGTFDGRGSELEERLGPPGDGFGAQLILTEDYLSAWSATFAAPDGPSTYLVNARGEFVWKRDGELDAGAVASALDEHALPAPPPQMERLRLRVRAGTRAPDTIFTDERWEHTSLRRLRGRRVVLAFWQSWSAPCLRELRRLEQTQRDEGAPFVLAISGGESCDVLAEVRRTHGLSFPLIQDPDQRIAGLYGVRCWPTTISINEAGIVDRIQLGLAHPAEEPAVATAEAPAQR